MNRDRLLTATVVGGTALALAGCASAPEGPRFQGGGSAFQSHPHTGDAIAACDFNGDGRKGFVVSGGLVEGEQRTTVVTTGSGRFTTDLTLERGFDGLAAADLDGDGHCDFAGLTGGQGASSRSDFRIFYGTGGGRFPTTVSRSAEPAYPRALAAADTGGDGIGDIAVFYKAFREETDTVVFPGSRDRNRPRQASQHRLGATAAAALAADVDGDGDTDLAVLTTHRRIGLLVNRPGPSQSERSRAYGEATDAGRLAADLVSGDFDGDGDADLAVADPGEARVFLFTGGTRPAMAATYRFPVHARPQGLAATDLDGDGRDDLVVLRQGPDGSVLTGLQVLSEGNGLTFRNRGDHRVAELTQASHLRLTDLDETGGRDAVVWGRSGEEPGLATVRNLTIAAPAP